LGTLFQSLFVINEVHTDPHLGNAFYRSDSQGNPEFVLLDFGCTMPVKNEVSLSLLKLIIAAHENSATDCFSCLVNCGFEEEKLAHIANTLPALCKLMFEPFLNDDPFLTDDWNLSPRMDSLLGDLRWWFRSAAPPNFLLLLRAFQGVVSQLQTLEVGIPWWTVLVEVIGEDRMDEARNFPTPKIDQISRNVATYDALAEKLKVLVTEEGQQVVALTLPAATVLHLKDTMPEHVITEIEKQNIDLNHIIRTACEGGLGAEPLFSLQVRKRNYKVWLE
jgi:predicted unusual protein kinase regulating ubiquinone biosynthesis (AarF/ABC1/UbiB family)